MLKKCTVCTFSFTTKDSRQKTCGSFCANQSRKAWRPIAPSSPPKPSITPVETHDLPPPEQLPAPYAKRVYDLWATLIGEKESVTRIA